MLAHGVVLLVMLWVDQALNNGVCAWGFELNSVTYNMRYFKEAGLTPPKDLPEMSRSS